MILAHYEDFVDLITRALKLNQEDGYDAGEIITMLHQQGVIEVKKWQ